jgi:hypothetical protein
LDSTKGDIKFLKGNPDKDSDDGMWFYSREKKSNYLIIFKDNKVRAIGFEGRFPYGDLLQGISTLSGCQRFRNCLTPCFHRSPNYEDIAKSKKKSICVKKSEERSCFIPFLYS